MAAKKSPKKNETKKKITKKKESQLPTIELGEIVKCRMVQYYSDGYPIVIYEKVSDSTLQAAFVEMDTDRTYLEKIYRRPNKLGDLFPTL